MFVLRTQSKLDIAAGIKNFVETVVFLWILLNYWRQTTLKRSANGRGFGTTKSDNLQSTIALGRKSTKNENFQNFRKGRKS